MPQFLTVEDVAESLQVNKNTVYQWVRAGHLKAQRLSKGGQIRISEANYREFCDGLELV